MRSQACSNMERVVPVVQYREQWLFLLQVTPAGLYGFLFFLPFDKINKKKKVGFSTNFFSLITFKRPWEKAITPLSPTKQPFTQVCPQGLMWSCSMYLPQAQRELRGLFSLLLHPEQGLRESQWRGIGMFPHTNPHSRCVCRYTFIHIHILQTQHKECGYLIQRSKHSSPLHSLSLPFSFSESRRHLNDDSQHTRDEREPGRQETVLTSHFAAVGCHRKDKQLHGDLPRLYRTIPSVWEWESKTVSKSCVKNREMSDTIN